MRCVPATDPASPHTALASASHPSRSALSARPSPRTVEPTPGRPAARPQLTPPLRYTHDTSQYGEFPLTGLLKLLEHPAVDEALHAAEHKEGSVDEADKISRAHAFFEDCDPTVDETCDLEHTPHAFQPSLLDVGSGAGRLVLAAATMRPWRSVCGIEACLLYTSDAADDLLLPTIYSV